MQNSSAGHSRCFVCPRLAVGVVPACRVGRRRRLGRSHRSQLDPATGSQRRVPRRALLGCSRRYGGQAGLGPARLGPPAVRGDRGPELDQRGCSLLVHARPWRLSRGHWTPRRHHDPRGPAQGSGRQGSRRRPAAARRDRQTAGHASGTRCSNPSAMPATVPPSAGSTTSSEHLRRSCGCGWPTLSNKRSH